MPADEEWTPDALKEYIDSEFASFKDEFKALEGDVGDLNDKVDTIQSAQETQAGGSASLNKALTVILGVVGALTAVGLLVVALVH